MRNVLALVALAGLVVACGPAEWEETGPVPVTVVGPVTVVPDVTTQPPANDPPVVTPTPTPTPSPTPPGIKVITPKQCADLVMGLDKHALKCLRDYLKKGYNTYPIGNTMVIIDKNCKDFILYYNCSKCK